MVVFVAYVLWVISRCLYKSLADMTDSNSAPGNHGRLKPWLRTSQQKPPAGPPSTHHLGWFQRGHQRMVLAAAVRLRSTLDREVGFHHLQTENGDGDICWRRWGWHVEEEPVGVVFFHRISMNFMWMSNDEAYQLISPWNLEKKWLQVPQSNRNLEFDLHPFCWRNVRQHLRFIASWRKLNCLRFLKLSDDLNVKRFRGWSR